MSLTSELAEYIDKPAFRRKVVGRKVNDALAGVLVAIGSLRDAVAKYDEQAAAVNAEDAFGDGDRAGMQAAFGDAIEQVVGILVTATDSASVVLTAILDSPLIDVAKWESGEVMPDDLAIGVLFIKLPEWEVFLRKGNEMASLGFLKGEKGDPGNAGPQGPQGPAGVDGKSIHGQPTGPPDNNTGNEGDLLVIADTGELLRKESGVY
jgi:hypothetical protein